MATLLALFAKRRLSRSLGEEASQSAKRFYPVGAVLLRYVAQSAGALASIASTIGRNRLSGEDDLPAGFQ